MVFAPLAVMIRPIVRQGISNRAIISRTNKALTAVKLGEFLVQDFAKLIEHVHLRCHTIVLHNKNSQGSKTLIYND
jgi:hypothetical protein